MGVDDLTHEHLSPYIRMQSVDGKACVHLLAGCVVEIWFQVYIIILLTNPFIDHIQLQSPLWVRVRMEGVFDIAGVYGHEGKEDGADVVRDAFLFDFFQITYDGLRGNLRGTQAI